jgi:hypothetical protein
MHDRCDRPHYARIKLHYRRWHDHGDEPPLRIRSSRLDGASAKDEDGPSFGWNDGASPRRITRRSRATIALRRLRRAQRGYARLRRPPRFDASRPHDARFREAMDERRAEQQDLSGIRLSASSAQPRAQRHARSEQRTSRQHAGSPRCPSGRTSGPGSRTAGAGRPSG